MNIKLIIFAVVALLVGVGGGTGAVLLLAPKHPAADSLHVAAGDSLGALPSEAVRSDVQHALAQGDSVRDHVETIMAPAAGSAAAAAPGAASAASGASPAPRGNGSAAAHAASPDDGKAHVVSAGLAAPPTANMSGIFLSMKPAEAARIMALLPDDQAADILRQIEPRQAAGILSQLPPDRAAAVSRRLLLSHVTAEVGK